MAWHSFPPPPPFLKKNHALFMLMPCHTCYGITIGRWTQLMENATTMCVEHMWNPTTVDEEFQALVEYVKHQLLVKASMALDATWKEKKAQKVEEYVKEKM
jgi:hypothetical protein